eukprot:1492098-Rhodomonas_salina.1
MVSLERCSCSKRVFHLDEAHGCAVFLAPASADMGSGASRAVDRQPMTSKHSHSDSQQQIGRPCCERRSAREGVLASGREGGIGRESSGQSLPDAAAMACMAKEMGLIMMRWR